MTPAERLGETLGYRDWLRDALAAPRWKREHQGPIDISMVEDAA